MRSKRTSRLSFQDERHDAFRAQLNLKSAIGDAH